MNTTFNISLHPEGSAAVADSVLSDAILRIKSIGLTLSALEWWTIEDFADHVADAVGARPYRWFDYCIPAALQYATIDRLRKPYQAKLAYIDSAPGDDGGTAIICLGGTVNSARRFDFLAADLSAAHRVISVDWPGRGRSGWLAQQSHYTPALLSLAVESLIDGLGLRRVTIVGSSLGGLIGMDIAARRPSLVNRVVLNDIGPEIPGGHRQRRAEAVSRYHLFQTPSDLFRRAGAAQKHDGPLSDAVRLHNIMGQTKRCDAGGGREYRHDPRTTQAYAEQVTKDINQWNDFHALQCPILLLHGEDSEVTPPEMVRRMQMVKSDSLTVVHVPLTGHTPALADRDATSVIGSWLAGVTLPAESTLPAPPTPTRLLFVDASPEAEAQPRTTTTAAILA
ncbi:alpha/beta hydrolase [Telmatospirillum siberiense]|uniref:Alpha/beta hydrolase n=1 Tax=Telmatospirillum siberiense TaxID=382514 RepID=A0A2N3PW71_9PROT|nr:alpha/beta hydrolase [Telmatospirillum siberiense]